MARIDAAAVLKGHSAGNKVVLAESTTINVITAGLEQLSNPAGYSATQFKFVQASQSKYYEHIYMRLVG